MFCVEYRTIGREGRVYPSCFTNVGSHKAIDKGSALNYVISKLGNVEVLRVVYAGSL